MSFEIFNPKKKDSNNEIKKIYEKNILERITDGEFKEVEKTEEDKEMILDIIEKINKYKDKIGIMDKFEILNLNQIHFLKNKEIFRHGQKTDFGFFEDDTGNLFIDNTVNKNIKFKTILHELVHHASAMKSLIDIDLIKDEIFSPEKNRIGYELVGSNKLSSFNEAITEKITDEIWGNNNIKEITNDENESDNSYFFEKEILEILIKKISEKTKQPYKDIWETILKNYFNGGMMNLRIFEKVYGKDFLKILANPEKIFHSYDLTEQDLKEIFSETDKRKRDNLIIGKIGKEEFENIFKN